MVIDAHKLLGQKKKTRRINQYKPAQKISTNTTEHYFCTSSTVLGPLKVKCCVVHTKHKLEGELILFSAAMQSESVMMYWEERERTKLRLALEYIACVVKDRTFNCVIFSHDERSRSVAFRPIATRGRLSIILTLTPHTTQHTGLHFPSSTALTTHTQLITLITLQHLLFFSRCYSEGVQQKFDRYWKITTSQKKYYFFLFYYHKCTFIPSKKNKEYE